jgi:hypothetical protein
MEACVDYGTFSLRARRDSQGAHRELGLEFIQNFLYKDLLFSLKLKRKR